VATSIFDIVTLTLVFDLHIENLKTLDMVTGLEINVRQSVTVKNPGGHIGFFTCQSNLAQSD
jgi:hypothetical protein